MAGSKEPQGFLLLGIPSRLPALASLAVGKGDPQSGPGHADCSDTALQWLFPQLQHGSKREHTIGPTPSSGTQTLAFYGQSSNDHTVL